MAKDHGDVTMASYVKPPWESGDMATVIAKLQQSGSIYFHKLLARLPKRKFGQFRTLVVPAWFVHEHADEFEERTVLRTQSSSKSWSVRFSVYLKNKSPQVKFMGGWRSFAVDNRLKEGDSLVLVLNVNATPPEFQVYIFRGTGRSSEVLTSTKRKALASQHGTNSLQPSFRTQITATNRERGRLEVPKSFVKPHGMQLPEEVKLQGIYKESPVRTVTCRQHKERNQARIYFKNGWDRFSKENGLHEGQELQFTLVSEARFIVRAV